MKAYILIQAEPGMDGQLAREVAGVPGVTWVERVTGPYDLIAEAEWGDVGMRAVVPRIQKLSGVLRALTSLVLDEPAPKGPVTSLDEHQMTARGA